jgi:undecaprenyl-diphosphatase
VTPQPAPPAQPSPPPIGQPESRVRRESQGLRELDTLDRAVFTTIATVPTPTLDRALTRLSRTADYSKLWFAGAAALAVFGGERGRRAAVAGMASVGIASAVSNALVKWLLPRRRPDRSAAAVPEIRWVRMPTSLSFPSGHSASAFAFATAVGSVIPPLSLPLHALAVAVAYSRVHTGVHYPGDTIAGALIGTAAAAAVRRSALRRRASRRAAPPRGSAG